MCFGSFSNLKSLLLTVSDFTVVSLRNYHAAINVRFLSISMKLLSMQHSKQNRGMISNIICDQFTAYYASGV